MRTEIAKAMLEVGVGRRFTTEDTESTEETETNGIRSEKSRALA
jgi:hypothetical protein